MSKKKGRLPKRIGGVKLPKELRRAAEGLIDQAKGPAGRELLAAGLTMAAAALRPATDPSTPHPTASAEGVAEPPRPRPEQMGAAFASVATAALGRWLDTARRESQAHDPLAKRD